MAMLLSSFSFEMVNAAYRVYSQILNIPCNFKKMHCLSINSKTRNFDSTTSIHMPLGFLIRKEISLRERSIYQWSIRKLRKNYWAGGGEGNKRKNY